jgi:hypothetical protein
VYTPEQIAAGKTAAARWGAADTINTNNANNKMNQASMAALFQALLAKQQSFNPFAGLGGGGGGGGMSGADQLARAQWMRDNDISNINIRNTGIGQNRTMYDTMGATQGERTNQRLSGLLAQRNVDAADNAASKAFYGKRTDLQNAASRQANALATWKQGSEAVTRGSYGGYGDTRIKADLLAQMQNQIGQQTGEGAWRQGQQDFQDQRSANQYNTDVANTGYDQRDFAAQQAQRYGNLENELATNRNATALANQQVTWAAQQAGVPVPGAAPAGPFGAGLQGQQLANFNKFFGKR